MGAVKWLFRFVSEFGGKVLILGGRWDLEVQPVAWPGGGEGGGFDKRGTQKNLRVGLGTLCAFV